MGMLLGTNDVALTQQHKIGRRYHAGLHAGHAGLSCLTVAAGAYPRARRQMSTYLELKFPFRMQCRLCWHCCISVWGFVLDLAACLIEQ